MRTLQRWLHDDDLFIRRYRELRRAAVEQGIAKLQGLIDPAVDCLHHNLTSFRLDYPADKDHISSFELLSQS